MKTKQYFLLLLVLTANSVFAQFKLDADVRPRFEYRHGFGDLFPDNTDPAAFISQRTRLNAAYALENIKLFVSVQDVRVWGDVPQLNSADNNGFSLHQAWAELFLDPNFSVKLGRQEVIYDDSRIFGNVDWAQQGRSHDLALLRYNKDSFRFDVGFGFNQSGQALTGNVLTTPNTYKAIQYVWLHKDWADFSGSFLFLNNGLQFVDPADEDNTDTRYSQTVGTHLVYAKDSWKLQSNLFYQFGNDVNDNDLSAYLLSLDANYNINSKWSSGLGVELISGNDNGAPSGGNNDAFNPFYGTNHKFNGLMDYFYVGNHINNVGLLDLYARVKVKWDERSDTSLVVHNFSAAADIAGNDSKQLGTEVDIVYSRKIYKDVILKAGYSHMFASEGLEVIRNNFDNNTNNWGWVMLIIKPTLFDTKK
ncbi:alginate export family protein [Leptobacterium flavescens]|uniref:Alginate export family protein n=1 Tax=Leptobacterium flavescens TaxID=472055 RepID=A0A6P0UMG9_9FLAO|nr:alginate export family protein [Leptobacterium flavescens]NER13650.1 alginate export family protein [Leptobacterium flavescens]